MGLVKTRRLAYPPLAGADAPWGSRQAERCECRAMRKQQRAKAGMTPLASKQARKCAPFPLQSSKRPSTKSLPPNH